MMAMMLEDRAMKALDLYAGAGGVARGLHQAGFDEIVGVDLHPQPNYPFRFLRGDALEYLRTADLSPFDFLWASPPCQRFTALRHAPGTKEHADLITPTRELLRRSGKLYCIENVVGAPLIDPIRLCGSMFGLQAPDGAQLQRHRLFETSFPLIPPTACRHCGPTIGVYGGHLRDRRRPSGANHKSGSDRPREHGFIAMGVPIGAMTLAELSEAIPPAYARYVAEVFLKAARAAVMERIHSEAERLTALHALLPTVGVGMARKGLR